MKGITTEHAKYGPEAQCISGCGINFHVWVGELSWATRDDVYREARRHARAGCAVEVTTAQIIRYEPAPKEG